MGHWPYYQHQQQQPFAYCSMQGFHRSCPFIFMPLQNYITSKLINEGNIYLDDLTPSFCYGQVCSQSNEIVNNLLFLYIQVNVPSGTGIGVERRDKSHIPHCIWLKRMSHESYCDSSTTTNALGLDRLSNPNPGCMEFVLDLWFFLSAWKWKTNSRKDFRMMGDKSCNSHCQ